MTTRSSVRQKILYIERRNPGEDSLKPGWSHAMGYRGVGQMVPARKHPDPVTLNQLIENAEANGDPTRTTTLRRQFEGKITKRLRAVKGIIRTNLIELDVLGLRQDAPDPLPDIRRTSYLQENANLPDRVLNQRNILEGAPRLKPEIFARDPNKSDLFMQWLEDVNNRVVLSLPEGQERISVFEGPARQAADQRWTDKWVRRSYLRGMTDGDVSLRKAGLSVPVIENYTPQLRRPIHAETLASMFTRTFRELEGITKDVERNILRTMTDGLAEGVGPENMARRMNHVVGGIPPVEGAPARAGRGGLHRARLMARTETIRTFNEAKLRRFEEHGIQNVAARTEWVTAGDNRVCPRCAGMEGTFHRIEDARGLIPLHPQCRCTWAPVVPQAAKQLDRDRLAQRRAGQFGPKPVDISEFVDVAEGTSAAAQTGAAAAPSPGDA